MKRNFPKNGRSITEVTLVFFLSLALSAAVSLAHSAPIRADAAALELNYGNYAGEGVLRNGNEARDLLQEVQKKSSKEEAEKEITEAVTPEEITEEQVRQITEMAEKGDAMAQYNMGYLTDMGLGGITKNKAEAVRWYTLAADQGFIEAQYNLGVIFIQGDGVAKDPDVAMKCFRKAAEQGSKESQFNLGIMYYNGQGVKRDTKEATKWFQLAADQDLAEAKEALKKIQSNK